MQVGVQHAAREAAAGKRRREGRRDEALAHAAFPAHHADHARNGLEARLHALALGHDLREEAGAVGSIEVIVRAHLAAHATSAPLAAAPAARPLFTHAESPTSPNAAPATSSPTSAARAFRRSSRSARAGSG